MPGQPFGRIDVAAELLRNPGMPIAGAGLAIVLLANVEAKRSLAQLRDYITEGVEATKARYARLAEIAREETIRLRGEQRAHELDVARVRAESLLPEIIPAATKAIAFEEPMPTGFEMQARALGDQELAQSLGNHYEGRAHVAPIEKFRAYEAEFARRFGDASWYDVANRGVVRIVVPSPPAPAAPTAAPEAPSPEQRKILDDLRASFDLIPTAGEAEFGAGKLLTEAALFVARIPTEAVNAAVAVGIGAGYRLTQNVSGQEQPTGLASEATVARRIDYFRRISRAIASFRFKEAARLKREAIEKGLW